MVQSRAGIWSEPPGHFAGRQPVRGSNNEWEREFFFFTSGLVGKPVCLMCYDAIKNLYKCDLQRHYNNEQKDQTEGQMIIVVRN